MVLPLGTQILWFISLETYNSKHIPFTKLQCGRERKRNREEERDREREKSNATQNVWKLYSLPMIRYGTSLIVTLIVFCAELYCPDCRDKGRKRVGPHSHFALHSTSPFVVVGQCADEMWKCKQSGATIRPFIYVQDSVDSSCTRMFAIDDALSAETKSGMQKEKVTLLSGTFINGGT